MRAEMGGKTLEGVVGKAHNPAPLPSTDRIPRGEVYEKIWVPLRLGTVDWTKGRTRLVLRATEIPGNEGFDLKAVKVRQVK